MKVISAINGSGLYAQYSISAEKDSKGNVITATYLTSANLNDYAKTEDVADAITGAIDDLSGVIDDKFYPKTNPSGYLVADDISGKLDIDDFTAWSATLDTTEYTAGPNIDITNHVISGKDWTTEINAASANAYDAATAYVEPITAASANWNTGYNWITSNSASVTSISSTVSSNSGKWTDGSTWAETNSANITSVSSTVNTNSAKWSSGYSGFDWITANSGDLATKDDIAKIGFATANSAGADSHPDVNDPSTQMIYLVKDTSVTGTDQYNEWIYSSADSTTAWVKIGDTSMDLTPYQLKLSAGNGIDINQSTNVISVTGELTPYSGGNGIQIQDHVISISANYLSANALDDLSGNWENTYTAVSTNSANWNNSYNWATDNSGNITVVSSTVNSNSSTWDTVTAKMDSSAMTGYYLKTETSSKEEISAGLDAKQDNLTFAYAEI